MNSKTKSYPHLFSPITIRGQKIKNRIVSSPNSGGPNLYRAGANGFSSFTETAAHYFASLARGGAGIVHTGHLGVDPRYYLGGNRERFDFFSDDIHEHQLTIMHMMTDLIHAYGAKAAIELNHGGHYGPPAGDWKRLGPCTTTLENGVEVQGMDEEEMNRVADYFANAALIGKRGGFDIVNVHAGHNWLLSEFFSPVVNKRTDEYGGSVENRARFPLMVMKRIREKVGDDMILQMRFTANEGLPGGITQEQVLETLKLFEGVVDIVQCSAGKIWNHMSEGYLFPMPYMEHGCNAYLARAVHGKLNMIIETVGGINEPEMADEFIKDGTCDLVASARSFVADNMWAKKARAGRADEIRPCIRCLRCMRYSSEPQTGCSVCTVNPTRVLHTPLPDNGPFVKKKVAVIGGGPAGMQAAQSLAEKGHDVILYEQSEKLGGRLSFTDHVEFKDDVGRYRDYLIHMVSKAPNIKVLLNTKATPQLLSLESPDAIVLAIGAEKFIPPVPGADGPNVIHAGDIYENLDRLGKRIVMVGGGLVGCETTIYLQSHGYSVDVVEMESTLMKDAQSELPYEVFFTEFFMTHEYSRDHHDLYSIPEIDRVKIHLNSRCNKITEDGVYVTDQDGKETFLECDTVILATGFRPNEALKSAYGGLAYDVIPIGDCDHVGDILNTSFSGYSMGMRI